MIRLSQSSPYDGNLYTSKDCLYIETEPRQPPNSNPQSPDHISFTSRRERRLRWRTRTFPLIMIAIWSEIAGVSIVCTTVCSGVDQRKHQSSASLAFVQRACNAENVSIWWRHHVTVEYDDFMPWKLFAALLALYSGNPVVTGGFSKQCIPLCFLKKWCCITVKQTVQCPVI